MAFKRPQRKIFFCRQIFSVFARKLGAKVLLKTEETAAATKINIPCKATALMFVTEVLLWQR